MKKNPLFLTFLLLLFALSALAQEPENGSFEEIDCKISSGCDIYFFYDDCMGPRWHNANREPQVLENDCVFSGFETPFGELMLNVTGGSSDDFTFTRSGDAVFYDLPMLNCQRFELSFWGRTHFLDAWVGLEFYAVESIEESTDLTLNLFPLKLIDLTGGTDVIVSGDSWTNYTVSLDVNNPPHPLGLPPAVRYNHLLIMANHHGAGQIPAVAYLDNFSIEPCTFDSEATLYHHLDEEDCGKVDFILDCDLADIKTFIWDFGDGSPLLQTDDPGISHLFQYAGEYDVQLTLINQDGCIDELTTPIQVTCDRCTGIEADFEFSLEFTQELYTWDPVTGEPVLLKYRCKYQFIDLSVASPEHQITSWHWDFGNGTTSDQQNPVRYFDSGTTHTVCLTIEDDQNCTATVCQEVEANCGRRKAPRKAAPGNLLSEWQVYPNPFQETIEVRYPVLPGLEQGWLKIFDVEGEEVYRKSLALNGQEIMAIGHLPEGIYLLALTDEQDRLLHQQKIVKQ